MRDILATQGRLTVRLEQDTYEEQPEGDSSAFLCAWHNREFYVAPPGVKGHFDPQAVIDQYKGTHWIFPLDAYIHSGVSLALAGEGGHWPDQQWDVSRNLGAIFCAKKEWRMRKKAEKYARAVVEEWNQYLSGDVWGYIVEDQDGETLESVWGFYGSEYAEKEARAALAYQAEQCDKIPTLVALK